MIVTSRLVGYREMQLGGAFVQFTISPFADEDIRRFAEKWYAALGVPDDAKQLVQAIQENPSVRRLAANPLLLTVIALIHWRGGTKLPHQRAKLYSQAAETLVDQWMSQRRVNPEGWDVHETLQVLLPATAWHLHSTTSSGLIGEQELHNLLVETLQQHDPRLSENAAHSRASQFRRNVSEFSGIFLERGLDQDGRGLYGFLHLTFEEYFAAVHLADKWAREGKSVLKPLLHDPRWSEPILLTAGLLSESSQYRATQFVKTILSAQSEYENILHRDLLLAVRCLGDDVRVDAELRRTISRRLLKIYFDSQSPPALREDIGQVFAQLSGTTVEKDMLKELTDHLAARKSYVRIAAARALGQMGPTVATPEVLSALRKLRTDPDGDVGKAATQALGQMGWAALTSEIFSILAEFLNSPDEIIRNTAAQTLEQMKQAETTSGILSALLVLLLRLLTDDDEVICWKAARIAGGMGQTAATPEILSVMLRLLDDPDEYVCWEAVKALGQMGPAAAMPEVLSAMLELLTYPDPGWNVSSEAAWTLGQMGQAAATPEVLLTLLKLLKDPDKDVRRAAIEALGQMGQAAATSEVLSTLIGFLTDPDKNKRKEAAWALGRIGQAVATSEVLSALLKSLADPEEEVRTAAAQVLGLLGPAAATPEILSVLLKFLADPSSNVLLTTTWALERMKQAAATADILLALLKLLIDPDKNVLVRFAAAEALGQMGAAAATPEVVAALLKCLTDSEGSVRWTAAGALRNLSAYVHPQERPVVMKFWLM